MANRSKQQAIDEGRAKEAHWAWHATVSAAFAACNFIERHRWWCRSFFGLTDGCWLLAGFVGWLAGWVDCLVRINLKDVNLFTLRFDFKKSKMESLCLSLCVRHVWLHNFELQKTVHYERKRTQPIIRLISNTHKNEHTRTHTYQQSLITAKSNCSNHRRKVDR